jgi:hypothetical protein
MLEKGNIIHAVHFDACSGVEYNMHMVCMQCSQPIYYQKRDPTHTPSTFVNATLVALLSTPAPLCVPRPITCVGLIHLLP